MRIYTKTGDDGTTGLFRGGRVSKAHPLIQMIGTVDELNSWLGLVRAGLESTSLRATLARLQHQMFEAGADLAALELIDGRIQPSRDRGDAGMGRLKTVHVEWLEATIDEYERELPELRQFILPGGSSAAAQCHVARAICRRAEREIVELEGLVTGGQPLGVLRIYLNRLADLLFVLARRINQLEQVAETVWGPDDLPGSE